ncbi:MAG TPA: hypothetical protein VLC46_07140 [Thermoanaerobaculia bacterium]|jgi:hypothetical protein|nr:hypothetical protein [Thermoanaerobaculia bacterium]
MRGNQGIHPPTFTGLLRLLPLLMLTLAAGCVSSAPSMTAGRALDAIRKGNLKDFQGQLTTKARPALGTEQEMAAVRQTLGHYTNVSVGSPLLVSSRQGNQGDGHVGDVRRTYTATVSGSPRKGAPPQAIYTLSLKCLLSYESYHHDEVPESCTTTIDENGIPWTSCTGGSPAYDSLDLGESCLISKIEEAPATSAE